MLNLRIEQLAALLESSQQLYESFQDEVKHTLDLLQHHLELQQIPHQSLEPPRYERPQHSDVFVGLLGNHGFIPLTETISIVQSHPTTVPPNTPEATGHPPVQEISGMGDTPPLPNFIEELNTILFPPKNTSQATSLSSTEPTTEPLDYITREYQYPNDQFTVL